MRALLTTGIIFLMNSSPAKAQMSVTGADPSPLISGVNTNITNVNSVGISAEGFSGISARHSGVLAAAVGQSYGSDGYGVYGVCTGTGGYSGHLEGANGVYVTPILGVNNVFPEHPLHVGTNNANGNGAHVTAGGAWTNGSSQTFKENFKPVVVKHILNKACDLKLYRWKYKDIDDGWHIGPMAEDFFEAFKLGNDARYISTVDADGVVLASIQALNQVYEERELLIEKLQHRILLLEKNNAAK
ncbi:MAG: tail fiber domain-containing protein [Saprospiraceae bacterium]|nr:tail fiber domain-containing protein [Saprospiraceae bacterium]